MALSDATRLADFATGIGTLGAVLSVNNTNNTIGLGTTNPQRMVQVGQNGTLDDSGINWTGVITATSFSGSGANLTDVISGVEIKLDGTSVGTAATVLNFGPGFSTATPVSAGISTIETTRTLTLGVRSGTAVTFSISGGSFNVSARSGNVAIDV